MPNSRNTTPCNSSSNASDGSSPEPIVCQCENQLAHWGWDGIPHEDLPELCRRSIGNWPGRNEKLTSAGNEAEEDKSASEKELTEIESDPDREWETEWQYCRNSEVTKSVNTEKVSLNAEKSGADLEDKPSTNPRKRRRSDKENSDTWTIKKSKKRTGIHIEFHHGEEQSRVKISVEFST